MLNRRRSVRRPADKAGRRVSVHGLRGHFRGLMIDESDDGIGVRTDGMKPIALNVGDTVLVCQLPAASVRIGSIRHCSEAGDGELRYGIEFSAPVESYSMIPANTDHPAYDHETPSPIGETEFADEDMSSLGYCASAGR